ncbi:DUF2085 domain-containing protein [Bacteroidota bacterium]
MTFNKNNNVRLLFLVLLLVWCSGFLFPVITPAFEGKSFISHIVGYNYSLVCHQPDPENFVFIESKFLVCARCAGIYLGALLTVIILIVGSFKMDLSLKTFILFSSPMFFDAAAVRVNLYSYSDLFSFFTGILFGGIAIIYIIEIIEKSLHLPRGKI